VGTSKRDGGISARELGGSFHAMYKRGHVED